MIIRRSTLSCLSALVAAALGLTFVGCVWGVVRDAQTSQPIVGTQVQFRDSKGKVGVTTTGTGGLYAFDAVQGQPIPAIGPVTFQVTASGYDTLTEQRDVSFDEGGGLWEVQSFALVRGGSGSGGGGGGGGGGGAPVTPTSSPTPQPTCIPSGDQSDIQSALTGAGAAAVLCQNAVFNLTETIFFTESGQEIYTEGFPTGLERAVLRLASPSITTAVNGLGVSGAKLENVIVDGNRPNLGFVPPPPIGEALIWFGGSFASGQVIDHVKAYEPRSWSTIQIHEGPSNSCSGATITNNEIGPAGQPDGTWADGISLSCRNSTVSGNTIVDATDGGIVVFGAPGSTISGNTIQAVTRSLLGGIAMVDYKPYDGDFTGTVVTGNTIAATGAQIKVAVGMGPRVWACPGPQWPAGPVRGGTVSNNSLFGAFMGYGFVADGVTDWTVSGNVSHATHSGAPGGGCGQTPAPPGPFLKHGVHSAGSFQPEFQEAYVESLLGIGPASPP